MLVDMGFSKAHAERVLRESSGNVSAAVAILLSTPEHEYVEGAGGEAVNEEDVGPPAGVNDDPGERSRRAADLELDSQLEEVLRLSQAENDSRLRKEEQELEAALAASLEQQQQQQPAQPVSEGSVGYVLPAHEAEALRPAAVAAAARGAAAPPSPVGAAGPAGSADAGKQPHPGAVPGGSKPGRPSGLSQTLFRQPHVQQLQQRQQQQNHAQHQFDVSAPPHEQSPPQQMRGPSASGLPRATGSRGGERKRPPGLHREAGDLDSRGGLGIGDLDSWSPGAAGGVQDLTPASLRSPPMQRGVHTPGSSGSGGRPSSSSAVGVEDLDGWGTSSTNFMRPALLPDLRRNGGSSSAPWLPGTSKPMPSSPHMKGGGVGGVFGLKSPVNAEDPGAARAAAMAASLPTRPPSRSGLHPMPRSHPSSQGTRGNSAMAVSRSSPLLVAGSASLSGAGAP